MLAEECLRQGKLEESLSDLKQRIRSDPGNARLRVFLFQLLAVNGEWDRALTQLTVAGELDDGNLAMVHAYREALRCEALRREIFAGERTPVLLGEPEPWTALLIEALRLTAQGNIARSQELRGQAFEAAPASRGRIDGQPFQWIGDADARLGPLLEALVNGRYCWVPWTRIRRVQMEPPADLRDVVWMPARFEWTNGGEAFGLIPTRYPGSESNPDEAIRLARRTEWLDQGHELCCGLGQRMLATDAGEHPLMEIRDVELDEAEGGDA
jgi:type VI secretion system protein ImpE